ncbi:MAG TPA: hypothetical protein VGI33_20775 [Paenibacillus sp.]|jgi:hypothetical protein
MARRSNRKTSNKVTRLSGKVEKPASPNHTQTSLSPQKIAVAAALLSGFFEIESVLYNRDNEVKVVLTSDMITGLPNVNLEEDAFDVIISGPD